MHPKHSNNQLYITDSRSNEEPEQEDSLVDTT